MRKWIARSLTITFAALAGCGHTAVAPTPPSSAAAAGAGDSQIVVSADLGSPDLIALWSVYGVALADAAEKAGRADYAGEVSARALLADRWKELRTERPLEKQLHDPYLDRLVEVRDAGFIGEYVLAFLARPGWTISGDELARLNAAAFKSWAAIHLPKDHRAVTAATVRLRGLPPTPIPGSRLPGTTDVNPAETPCANLRPEIDRAVADWDREARALTPVALSIELAEQTLPSLERLSRDPRARRDGVVFVAPAALEILFDAGFCAVDRGDWPTAEKMLRRAVELSRQRERPRRAGADAHHAEAPGRGGQPAGDRAGVLRFPLSDGDALAQARVHPLRSRQAHRLLPGLRALTGVRSAK